MSGSAPPQSTSSPPLRAPLQPRSSHTSAPNMRVDDGVRTCCKRLASDIATNMEAENKKTSTAVTHANMEALTVPVIKKARTSESDLTQNSEEDASTGGSKLVVTSCLETDDASGVSGVVGSANGASRDKDSCLCSAASADSNSIADSMTSNVEAVTIATSASLSSNTTNNNTSMESNSCSSNGTNRLCELNGTNKPACDNDASRNGNGLSPSVSSTLEYVSKLPEGCSQVSNAPTEILGDGGGGADSDGELEDDDNYLDSSSSDDEAGEANLNADDDESCGEDDGSVISSITVGSTSSMRSVSSDALNHVCINEHGQAANEDGSLVYGEEPSKNPLPPLQLSQFPNVSPTINFCLFNEKTASLPPAVASLLRWRASSITPLIVKKIVTNSGFRVTKKSFQWCGTWGKHMKSSCFKPIKEFQKLNHLPGTFQIGRKDKLWRNLSRLQNKFGKEEFGFIPKTFVLPGDLKALKAAFDKEGVKKKWIVKPPASARGTGIQVIHKWSQLPSEGPLIVQRYISLPYLINNTKFDLRIYALVTSFHPLRLYLYQDGLARFASVQYNSASSTLSDRYMHLTNYSVNKSSSSYSPNEDAGVCQGHKWTLKVLWAYLKSQGVDTQALWGRIADMVVKTMLSGEHDITPRTRKSVRSRYSCYELFGIDVILDSQLRPWLLEVNISPSLHSTSPLDSSVKGPLIADVLNLVGYHIPDKLTQQQQVDVLKEMQMGEEVTGLCLDRRQYCRALSAEELAKHLGTSSMPRQEYLTAALANLTPDDVRNLCTAEDELFRLGRFVRIFPTVETYSYLNFFTRPRYYNRLLDAWETAYSTCREKGLDLLKQLCAEKHHLKVPNSFKIPKRLVTGKKRQTETAGDQTNLNRQQSCHRQTEFKTSEHQHCLKSSNPLQQNEKSTVQETNPKSQMEQQQQQQQQQKREPSKCLKLEQMDSMTTTQPRMTVPILEQELHLEKPSTKDKMKNLMTMSSPHNRLPSTGCKKRRKKRRPVLGVDPLKRTVMKHFLSVRSVIEGREDLSVVDEDGCSSSLSNDEESLGSRLEEGGGSGSSSKLSTTDSGISISSSNHELDVDLLQHQLQQKDGEVLK